ncbi:MAG: LCP family protein [Schwartzia sp.]|nr:LCP family protein [Schwartzia sp. (in: firmicutes)]MBR1885613.1 LCP family protein [Schwartzia sp. (in: firmicutes)]
MTTKQSETRNNIRAKRRKRLLRAILGFFKLVFLLVALVAVGWASWQELLRGAAVYREYRAQYDAYRERREARRVPMDERFEAYMNILVLGVDKGGDFGGGHADTMLLVSLDNATGKVRVISIPRGTVVTAPDGVTWESLGGKFAEVGVSGMIQTVRNLLGVSVHHYAILDAQAFGSFIDAMGGVDVYVEMRMDYDDPALGLSIHIPQGFQRMNGDTAQKYLRFRSGELGDLGRVQRQHRFLKAFYGRLLSVETVGKLPALMKVLQEQVDTSVEVWDSAQLAAVLKGLSREEPETLMLPGKAYEGDDGIWIADGDQIALKVKQLFPKAEEAPAEEKP